MRLTFIYPSLPDRSGRNRGIRVRGGDELGTDRNQRVLPPTYSSRCKRKAPTVPPVQQPEIGETRSKCSVISETCPSRGDSFPPVLVMEAAENHASHNLAVLGKRNVCRDLAAVGIPRHVQESPVRVSLLQMLAGANAFEINDIQQAAVLTKR